MLDHDDEQRLAEIEAHLRLDAPDLQRLFEGDDETAPRELTTGRAVWRTIVGFAAAVVLTAVITVIAGPNLGGLVAVVSITGAGMYGYQVLRGCPGLRQGPDDDR